MQCRGVVDCAFYWFFITSVTLLAKVDDFGGVVRVRLLASISIKTARKRNKRASATSDFTYLSDVAVRETWDENRRCTVRRRYRHRNRTAWHRTQCDRQQEQVVSAGWGLFSVLKELWWQRTNLLYACMSADACYQWSTSSLEVLGSCQCCRQIVTQSAEILLSFTP